MKHAEWKVEDGLLYKYKRDLLLDPITDGGEGWRMVVPLKKRERVLHDSHCITSARHLGVDKTYDRWLGSIFGPEYIVMFTILCARVMFANSIRVYNKAHKD